MTKKVWDALLSKSQVTFNKTSSQVKAAKSQLDIDIARGARLDSLIEDYHSQLLSIQKQSKSTQQVQAIRSFISQIHQLKSKNIEQIDTSKKELTEARKKLSEVERERLKYSSLLDKEKEAIKKSQFQLEIKKQNEQATIQFNLKKR